MVDITHKNTTLRMATALAVVRVSKPETILAIQQRLVPKGDVLEMAKTAGLFAVKRTSDMIPDCHPLPIEYTAVSYQIEKLEISIFMTVKAIYRTGVEVEAMHGASVVALTMYDMLKPIDKQVEIGTIKLVEKKGGKSGSKHAHASSLTAAVVVCSDSISAGKKEDRAGKAIVAKLQECGVQVTDYVVIPDELSEIQAHTEAYCQQGLSMVVFTGGTGLSPRDITPEALMPLLDRRIPGIEEAIRNYGQDRMPYAMLSRSVAGTKGNSLILALPGSTNGAKESMEAIFPSVLHLFNIFKGAQHD